MAATEKPPVTGTGSVALDGLLTWVDQRFPLISTWKAHLAEYFADETRAAVKERIHEFVVRAEKEPLATDQLLNAVFLVVGKYGVPDEDKNALVRSITRALV